MNKILVSGMISLLTLGLMGCGDTCATEVIETTQLTNAVDQDLQIELCKIPYKQLTGAAGDKTATVAGVSIFEILSTQAGVYLVDSYPLELKKDSNNKCPTELPPSYNSQIFLTTTSMTQVKLCRNNLDPVKITLVNLGAACPIGMSAQTQAVANCNATALIDP